MLPRVQCVVGVRDTGWYSYNGGQQVAWDVFKPDGAYKHTPAGIKCFYYSIKLMRKMVSGLLVSNTALAGGQPGVMEDTHYRGVQK
jgi:hypothetical protein